MNKKYVNEPMPTPSAAEPETVYVAPAVDSHFYAQPQPHAEIERNLALEKSVISEEEIAEGYMTLEEFERHLRAFIHSKFASRR